MSDISDRADGPRPWINGAHLKNGGGEMEPSNLMWRKSSFSSSNGGDCVEVAELANAFHRPEHKRDATHAVRDSKDPCGPVLYFTLTEWNAFLNSIKSSEFDLMGPTTT
ncbi:DUF397 domain-containing protein [Streptosporangium sp. CA-135522]|uniref:DUF397 domain-containing protein n=1 Tax=Streptosporangium sp. CA-135522 TaxID=3240072 RepID=UPI003D9173B2